MNDDPLDRMGSRTGRAGRGRGCPITVIQPALVRQRLSERPRPSSRPRSGRSAPPWARSPVGDWADLDPDFAAGKKALSKGQWASAIEALKLAALRDPRNADIENYIGYAYRRIGLPKLAFAHFQQAIELQSAPPRRAPAPRRNLFVGWRTGEGRSTIDLRWKRFACSPARSTATSNGPSRFISSGWQAAEPGIHGVGSLGPQPRPGRSA